MINFVAFCSFAFVLKTADSSDGLEECLENVLYILEGKGFKIRLKSEQRKAIRKLDKVKDMFVVHFEM